MGSMVESQLVITAHRPNLREKTFFLLAGFILSVPISFFFETLAADYLANTISDQLVRYLLIISIAPLVEEFAKAYPLFYRHGETQRSIVTLGFLVGLGFGLTEFFTYVTALGAPVFIRLPGLAFHTASTSITAYGIAKKRPAVFYIISVFLHFLNNFSAVLGFAWFFVGIPAVSISIVLAYVLYKRTSEMMVE